MTKQQIYKVGKQGERGIINAGLSNIGKKYTRRISKTGRLIFIPLEDLETEVD